MTTQVQVVPTPSNPCIYSPPQKSTNTVRVTVQEYWGMLIHYGNICATVKQGIDPEFHTSCMDKSEIDIGVVGGV